MSVRKCKQEVSHREYLSWLEWFQLDQNTPSRADHYAMKIAQEIRSMAYSFHKKPPTVPNLEKFIIPFVLRKKAVTPIKLTVQERTARSQAMWCGRLGITRNSVNGK